MLEGWHPHLGEIPDPPLDKPTHRSNSTLRLARKPHQRARTDRIPATHGREYPRVQPTKVTLGGNSIITGATVVADRYCFRGLCVQGVCLWVWGWVYITLDTHPLDTHTLNTPPNTHARSTSGRYASYWNAFLFNIIFLLFIW